MLQSEANPMSMLVKLSLPMVAMSPLPVKRFIVDQYQRMTESGILMEDHDVELLEG